MACRGVHFALSPDEAEKVASADDDDDLMATIEEIEDRWNREWLVETDKAWDAIHRCLTGGTLEYGPTPLHKCVLGVANRHGGDGYIVNLLGTEEVKEEDCGYTRENFVDLRAFFEKAARHDRAVVFTVDQ